MSDAVIRCSNLSKRYTIGEVERYRTLRESMMNAVRAPFRRRDRGSRPAVWALRGASFEVQSGEVVGVIGRNGAGKSTLLKILSRITEPTSGEGEIHGRVGSLLEVGTGFHPELTGRENIFLNGAILGMGKTEISSKLDEIVAFAEIPEFIDTPVKRYSSGMYMRLAFAVAAHLETEILLVDEVLAVGDAEFQKKCLGRMNEAARSGRTVLFVSHSMPAMQRLCTRGILLRAGEIEMQGEMAAVAGRYLSEGAGSIYEAAAVPGRTTITSAAVSWNQSRGIELAVSFKSPEPLRPPVLGFVMEDRWGSRIFGTNAKFDPHAGQPAAMQAGTISIRVATEFLRPETYYFSLWLGDGHSDSCILQRAVSVDVAGGEDKGAVSSYYIGSFRLPTEWRYAPALTAESRRGGE
ncbi:MAG: ABC transporter ATP-binding protein [Acidobacteria bacterium]|nr:ABC transporter ATP-binding protein [Acidobacteriota bacterium]